MQPTHRSPPCSARKVLFIGEGNFSFALAWVKKLDQKADRTPEQSIASTIVATELGRIPHSAVPKELWNVNCSITAKELSGRINCENCDLLKKEETEEPIFCNNCLLTVKRIAELEERGAIIGLGIDGTKLHQIDVFKNTKFRRIHWNCPHDESRHSDYSVQTLPPIIADFFQSCAKMQDQRDRVHVALVQPSSNASYYQGYVYNIVDAATKAGYVLLKKRKFDGKKYPGYEHAKTRVNVTARVTEGGMREFVFKYIGLADFHRAREAVQQTHEKVLIKPLSEQFMKHSEKKFSVETGVFEGSPREYLRCSTDGETSSSE